MEKLYDLIIAPMTERYLESDDLAELAQRSLDLVNVLNDRAASATSPLVRQATARILDLCDKLVNQPMQSGPEVELVSACRSYADALNSGDAEGTAAARVKVIEAIYSATGHTEMLGKSN